MIQFCTILVIALLVLINIQLFVICKAIKKTNKPVLSYADLTKKENFAQAKPIEKTLRKPRVIIIDSKHEEKAIDNPELLEKW